MTLRGVHHVQISVGPGEVEAARVFYVELLGMTPIDDPFGGAGFWASAGGQDLHVRVEEGIDRRRTGAHVAYLVDDLEACRRRLSEAGLSLIPQPPLSGYDRVHVLDPAGNRVELMQRTD